MSWHRKAACLDEPEAMFPNGNLNVPVALRSDVPSEAEAYALTFCARCPVKSQCLVESFTSRWAEYGVWGGLTELQRMYARRARKAGAA